MKRRDYLSDLERRLDRLSVEERVDALAYYDEILEDRGVGHDDEVPGDMPSPRQASYEILRDSQVDELRGAHPRGEPLLDAERLDHTPYSEGYSATGEESKKYKGSTVLVAVILGILALPIGLPIALALIAVVIALSFAVLAVVIGVVVSGVAFTVQSGVEIVAMLGSGTFVLPQFLFYLGTIFLAMALILIAISAVQGLIRHVGRQVIRSQEKRRAKQEARGYRPGANQGGQS